MKKLMAIVVSFLTLPALALAQKGEDTVHGEGYVFAGLSEAGPSSAVSINADGINTGFGGDIFGPHGLGAEAEVGYANDNNHAAVGTGTLDLSYHLLSSSRHSKLEPFASGGYSIYYGHRGTSSGYNLGGGINFGVIKHMALRFEIRDYAHIGAQFLGAGNFVAFRAGVTFR
jgi:opacity protein-like surface antigen